MEARVIKYDSRRDKKRNLNLLRSQLETERSSFMPRWRTLAENILPTKPRFDVSDVNKGESRTQNIYNNTATASSNTLRSGMTSGITSPARPWFRLSTPDPTQADLGSIKRWLHDSTEIMRWIFTKSNLYQTLPGVYEDMGVFATGCMLVERDLDKIVRFRHIPIGSYMIAVNNAGQVDTWIREYRMTARQIVEEFAMDANGEIDWSNISAVVKECYESEEGMERWFDICHVIRPNPRYRPGSMDPKRKRYESVTYEKGTAGFDNQSYNDPSYDKFLREAGYKFFPVLVPRWQVTGEDSWGTNCPGMTAIGDTKALQVLEKRKSQALDKMVHPPMVAPLSARFSRKSQLPGDTTYVDETSDKKIRQMLDIQIQYDVVLQDIAAHEERIKRAFFADLFLMMINDERTQPPTAEEIVERRSEKMLALGPVLEQLNQDLLDPLIDIVFEIALERGLIPEPPPELEGIELRVEYVSIMAQAQKSMNVSSLERFAGMLTKVQAETQDPAVGYRWNKSEWAQEYGESLGMSPKILRSDEEVEELMQQAAEQQRQAQQVEATRELAGAAKDLGQTPAGGEQESLLDKLMQAGQAGSLTPQVA